MFGYGGRKKPELGLPVLPGWGALHGLLWPSGSV